MAYAAPDRSPISPSFTSNPFDKYKTARGDLPGGIGGIGTGSSDRYSARKKPGERKRIIRVIVAAFLVGFVFWFMLTPLNWNGTPRDGSIAKAPSGSLDKAAAEGDRLDPPTDPGTPVGSGTDCAYVRPGQIGQEKATFVMLIRNSELKSALESMKQIEDRFNHRYHYPWVFLNDVPFNDVFIKETTKRASGKTQYGIIPKHQWSIPDEIDTEKMQAAMDDMVKNRVIYGGSLSYRHMCRFNSGFFFQQELMAQYDWYWRVEPGIGFYCDVVYDPFAMMRASGKKYGFTITLPEYKTTIPTLWSETIKFMKENPQYLASNSSLQFLLDDKSQGKSLTDDPPPEYNGCHFWSNFEIASLDLWRGEAYQKYFAHLDKAGGFFYERWGDAPVHSIAAALFLNTQEVHHFADMGYFHNPWKRAPQPNEFYEYAKCVIPFKKEESFDLHGWSCQPKWWKIAGKEYGS